MSSGKEHAQQIIADISNQNIDDWVRTKTFVNEVEEGIRSHIHQKLNGWLFFRKLAADCARANICLHGFALLWEKKAQKCLLDATWLEKYLLSRGGHCKPASIEAPKIQVPENPVEPLGPTKEAFLMEKRMMEDLERLATLADKCGDDSLTYVIQAKFLRKANREVKDFGDLLQQVARVSKQPGMGIYILDKELRCHKGCIPWSDCNDPEEGLKKLKEVFEETAKKELEVLK